MDGTLLAALLAGLWLLAAGMALALARASALADRAYERGENGEAGLAAGGAGAPPLTVPGRGPALSTHDEEPPALADDAAAPVPASAHTGYGGLVLDRLARHACVLLGVEQTVIFVRDESDPRVVVPVAGSGADEDLLATRLAADEGAVGLVLRTGRAMWLGRGQPVAAGADWAAAPSAGAWAPIRHGGVVRGAFLAVPPKGSRPFDERRLDMLKRLAETAAAALEDRPLRASIEPAMRGGTTALEAALELADPKAAAHGAEVARLSRLIGEELQLEPAALIELDMAARLFQVGRIAYGRLGARGPLPVSAGRRGGTEAAAELIGRVPGLDIVAVIVLHYGERWDGLGRPDGLRADRIPLASRIVAAADAYALLVAEEAGGAEMPALEALASLHAGAASRFDPVVVDALRHAMERAGLAAGT